MRCAAAVRRRLLAPLGALTLTLSACGGDGRTPLVVYSPHGRDLLQLFEVEFERVRPDIDFRFLDMGSQEVYDRIRSERANPQADIWFGGPDAIFARAAADGLLAPYRPSWADAVPEASRGGGDLYFGTYRTIPVLVWNARTVSAPPADWEELLDERFAGRVLVRDPMASGVMRTFFGYVLARAEAGPGSISDGWAWLTRLDAATRDYVANPALLFEKLARGEGDVTVWELTDVLLHRAAGDPVDYALPASGTPVIDDSVARVAGAPHGEAAAAFLEWVGSVEAQRLAAERAFRLPARTDLPPDELPDWARDVLARLVVADYDADRAAAQGAAWMAQWDAEVRGRGRAAARASSAP